MGMKWAICVILLVVSVADGKTMREGYDPLSLRPSIKVEVKDVEFVDRKREREIPLRVYWNPNHHQAIIALSTAFWDAYLNKQLPARKWLEGGGARSVLEEGDRWQRK